VNRIQNATQNVVGKMAGIGRGIQNIGGLANKFGSGLLKF